MVFPEDGGEGEMEEPQRPERPSTESPDDRIRLVGLVVSIAAPITAGFAFTDPAAGLAARVFLPLFLLGVGLLVLLQERRSTAEGGDGRAAEHARRLEGTTRAVLVIMLGVAVATVFDGGSDGVMRVLAIPLAATLMILARRVLPLLERRTT